ncbi:hypothetical protein HAX54_012806, partial [Datura stramonium]|nr:hypothetical protein [Datura stramonium]
PATPASTNTVFVESSPSLSFHPVVPIRSSVTPGSRPPALSVVSDPGSQARNGHGQSQIPVSDSPSLFASSTILIRSFLIIR